MSEKLTRRERWTIDGKTVIDLRDVRHENDLICRILLEIEKHKHWGHIAERMRSVLHPHPETLGYFYSMLPILNDYFVFVLKPGQLLADEMRWEKND